MSDREELAGYVDVWWTAVTDLTSLLDELGPPDWAQPTDLPGWDVKAVASHTAHLESMLAGGPEEQADIGEPPHVTGPMGQYTEIGVVTRRDRSPESIVAEIRETTARRRTELEASPPADGDAPAPGIFGMIGWSTRLLLRNRPLDVWMHEQDVRRAVGRPGGMDSPAAQHVADYLLQGLGFVVGKRVRPPAGTTVVLEVEGSAPQAVEVGDDGRAKPVADVPPEPTVRLAMGREEFIVLAGGRRRVEDVTGISITGDADLGQRILSNLATTP